MDAIFYGIAYMCEHYLFPAMAWLGNAPNALIVTAGIIGFAVWTALLVKYRKQSKESEHLE